MLYLFNTLLPMTPEIHSTNLQNEDMYTVNFNWPLLQSPVFHKDGKQCWSVIFKVKKNDQYMYYLTTRI